MLLIAGVSYTASLCYTCFLKRSKNQRVGIMIVRSSIFLRSKSKYNEYKNVLTLYETDTNFHPVSFNQYA